MSAGDLTAPRRQQRSEEHTSELQSPDQLVCRLLIEKKNFHPHHQLILRDSRVIHQNMQSAELLRNRFNNGIQRNIFAVLFFFNDTATTEIYTLSLHDALPI